MKPLLEIEIPEFIVRVKTSEARRAKYYKPSDKIPKKYQGTNFEFREFKVGKRKVKHLTQIDTRERVIANPRSAGTAGYINLSGNMFMSGFTKPVTRSKMVNGLKDFYKRLLKNKISKLATFPLRIEWDVYTVTDHRFDMSNLSFYYKYFEDTLVDLGVIPDDSHEYISWPPGPKLFSVATEQERKFVFRFYHDKR